MRAGWWMRSSVAAARRCAGSARPASSSPMRPRLNTASARVIVSGRACRAWGVARLRSGTMATKARSSAERQRRVHGPALHRRRGDEPSEHGWPPRSRDARRRRPQRRRDPRLRPRPRPRRRGRRRSPVRGRRVSASAPSRRGGRGRAPRPPPVRPGATRRRRVRTLRPRCARAARARARPRRSRSSPARRPACRIPGRGWPTTRGPGRARGYRPLRSEQALAERRAGHVAPEPDRHGDPLGPERHHDRAHAGAPPRPGRSAVPRLEDPRTR